MSRLHTLGALALITALAVLLALPSPGVDIDPAEDAHEAVTTPEASIAATAAPLETSTYTVEILPSTPPTAAAEPSQAQQATGPYTERELEMVAKTVWGEARGCAPDEQRLVIWTIFQQVDADGDFARYSTVAEIITKPNNYAGYSENHPLDPDIYALVCEEAVKWANGEEPPTMDPYAPTLPYLFFDGDGTHNWFRAEWR